jgi:membrane associated rhomboid family serine protease
LATGPKVCRAKPPLQLQQSYAGQVLNSSWPPSFVHGSLFHLVGNMIFLFVFGGTLQNSIGSGRYLAVFLTGGFAGFVLSLPFTPRLTSPSSPSSLKVSFMLCESGWKRGQRAGDNLQSKSK